MNWGWGIAMAAALGMGSLVVWLLLGVNQALGRLRRFRLAQTPDELLYHAHSQKVAQEEFTLDDLYGLGDVPWNLWRILGALIGVFLAYLLFAERNPALATPGLAGVFVPRLVQHFLVQRRRADVDRQVRDFIFLLRPALGLRGGLRPALEEVAERLSPGVVRERLNFRLEQAFVTPVEIIEALAADLRSVEMDSLLLSIRAARQGGMSYGEAVAWAAEDAAAHIREQARMAIEETPVRLLIPMLVLLVPPILVLSLYPLIARLMATLAMPASVGTSW